MRLSFPPATQMFQFARLSLACSWIQQAVQMTYLGIPGSINLRIQCKMNINLLIALTCHDISFLSITARKRGWCGPYKKNGG